MADWSAAIAGVAGIAACQLYVVRAFQVDLRPPERKGARRKPEPSLLDRPTSTPAADVATRDRAPGGLRLSTGGLLLWSGTISIGVSTVIVLAAVSRHFHHEDFSGLATLFGLFFVASLVPSGIPLRAAALEVDGAPPMRVSRRNFLVMVAVGLAISPPIAFGLHLPLLAVVLVAAQVIIAIPLSIHRGSRLAAQRFDAIGGNLFLEGGSRVIFGTVAGVLWGMSGVAGGFALATFVALLAMPLRNTSVPRTYRHMTSLVHTWLALVLLGLFVQMDILVAPRGLAHAQVIRYDLAALPSKGVYLVVAALSTLIFPYVRLHASRRTVVLWATATLGAGLAVTGALVVLRHTVGSILGQSTASLPLLVALGAAMSIAGATGIVINGGIALGVARPWPPLLLGIGCLLACGVTHPTATVFATVVLAAQVGTLLVTSVVCLRKRSPLIARAALVEGGAGTAQTNGAPSPPDGVVSLLGTRPPTEVGARALRFRRSGPP